MFIQNSTIQLITEKSTLTCMFGYHLYGWMPPLYVWMMFGCQLYIYNTKKAGFVKLRECPYAPICLDAPLYVCMSLVCLDAPYVWMNPLYVWIPPYVWMAACMFGCPHMFGHHLCVWIPPLCLDASCMF